MPKDRRPAHAPPLQVSVAAPQAQTHNLSLEDTLVFTITMCVRDWLWIPSATSDWHLLYPDEDASLRELLDAMMTAVQTLVQTRSQEPPGVPQQ